MVNRENLDFETNKYAYIFQKFETIRSLLKNF